MQQLLKIGLIVLQLSVVAWADGETSQPYCYRNITETSYKVVTKTRLKNVSSKNFFKKIAFKKDTQVEIYEDQEPVYKTKLERICCEGYRLSELELCEPQCEQNGCPQHSKCVEPEVCECVKGYFSTRSVHDGKHYCEPICEKPCPKYSACVAPDKCACHKGYHLKDDMQCKPYCASGCPHGGVCVSPNTCSCQDGYKSEKGSCLPSCSLGDQCQNGRCMGKDRCICNYGFRWNSEIFKCEHEDVEFTTHYPDSEESDQTTDAFMEVESDIVTFNDDVDPIEVFREDTSSTTPAIEMPHKCPDDYVLHKGECRPLKFVSNELDCWLKPCLGKHAVCLENGTCACTEGFKLFKTQLANHNSLNQSTTSECLTAAEYEAKLQLLKQPFKEPIDWTLIFFIILGVLVILSAVVYLGINFILKRTGAADIEGKNLSCAYDSRAATETEKSVI